MNRSATVMPSYVGSQATCLVGIGLMQRLLCLHCVLFFCLVGLFFGSLPLAEASVDHFIIYLVLFYDQAGLRCEVGS